MAKEERYLTPAEAKRKEIFEGKATKLEQEGYVKKDLTVSVFMANVMAIVLMLPIMAGFFWLYYVANGGFSQEFDMISALLFIGLLLVLVVVHELIHGITWSFFTKERFHSIEFGVIWSMLTPYCTCKEELKKWQYILGSIMPTFIVGILPTVLAILLHSELLFEIGLLMIFGGGGDMLITLKILFYREKGSSVYMDHPYKCGVVVFEKE